MAYGMIGTVNTYAAYCAMKRDYNHVPIPYEQWVTWQNKTKENEVFK